MEAVGQEHNSGKRSRGALAGGVTAVAAWRSCRVARAAAGGKDRHSKVVTARGLRDRRVRLSVPTAIQFYDLQDRLGVDQPSKAIEWLIRAAAAAIDALPSLDCSFPFPSPAAADRADDAEASTSETSKGSVLSLANATDYANANANANANATDYANANANDRHTGVDHANARLIELLNCSTVERTMQPPPPAYHAAESPHLSPMRFDMAPQLAFSQEPHLAAGFDRGTLQSNAAAAQLWPPSHDLCLMQRFATPADAPGLTFFLAGGAGAAPAAADVERRLHVWDFKGQGKS